MRAGRRPESEHGKKASYTRCNATGNHVQYSKVMSKEGKYYVWDDMPMNRMWVKS